HTVPVYFACESLSNIRHPNATLSPYTTLFRSKVTSDTGTQFSGVPGQTITLKGNLKRTSDNTGLSGRTLTFKVDGTAVGTATTKSRRGAVLNPDKVPSSLRVSAHTQKSEFARD